MGLFSMSGRKKRRTNQGSGYYQQQGFMGKLGGFMGSFSSSDRKRYGHGYPQQAAQPFPGQVQAAPQTQTPHPSSSAGSLSCPKCNAQVPAGSKFCLECGEKLGGGFCAQCGATLPPSAKFCPECGTPRGWRLDAVLGQGRFGTCFRASRASGEPRIAALKLIRPEQGSLDRDALWREAKALSLCAHPAVPRWLGIVRERDDARDRGRCFMAQSLMPGTSLDRLLFRQRRSFDQAAIASIGRQVIDALAHLEGRGVAHGDVRPANLLIDAEGTVSLVDFGLAGFFDRNAASPAATASDRAGLADVLLFLLYASPAAVRSRRHAKLPWFDDLDLPAAQRSLLLDLFSDEPVLHGFASIGDAFEEAFAAPPTA